MKNLTINFRKNKKFIYDRGMIQNIINFFFPNYNDIEEKRPRKVGIFFGTNDGDFMNYLFYDKKYSSIYFYNNNEITKELIFSKIKDKVGQLYHGDTLFLYFGSGKSVGMDVIDFFRTLRKQIHIFLLIENYKKNFFPVPYVIQYPNQRIRIRNDELYVPLIISIYSSDGGLLQILEETFKSFRFDKINIRMLLMKLQDKFIELKKDDSKLPEICISSMDCFYYEL